MLINHFCPEDPPPPTPAVDPSAQTSSQKSGASSRVITPSIDPTPIMAVGAAAALAVAAKPWYARALAWTSRAAAGAGMIALRAATLVFPVFTIGPIPTSNPHPKPDWT